MTITERAAYIKGLAEGLGIDESTKEGKVIKALIDAFDDMALTVSDLEAVLDELTEQVRDDRRGPRVLSKRTITTSTTSATATSAARRTLRTATSMRSAARPAATSSASIPTCWKRDRPPARTAASCWSSTLRTTGKRPKTPTTKTNKGFPERIPSEDTPPPAGCFHC